MGDLTEHQTFLVHAAEVWNCANAFEVVCPQQWNSLDPTHEPNVRFCPVCHQKVHRCTTALEFVTHGELGHCVAVPEGCAPESAIPKAVVGRPRADYARQMQRRVQAAREWWRGVLGEMPNFAKDAFAEVLRLLRRYI